MKTYIDMTKTQLKRECAKIVEKATGIKPLVKQIVLLEASEDRVYFVCGNITIDHRDTDVFGSNSSHDYIEVINGGGWISVINMKKERIGEHYRLFTMKINGVKYYFIGRLDVKGICFMSDKSEQAVEMFEQLERSNSVKENEK